MATPDDIHRLILLLRDHADKIRSDQYKFALSTDLLHDINLHLNATRNTDSSSPDRSFRVLTSSRDTFGDTFGTERDAEFLHDLIRTSPSLKLTPGSRIRDADLGKFEGLRLLELRKVDVDSVEGLSRLRAGLRHLVCERGVRSLRDLFEKCGKDDKTDGGYWVELREVVLSRNSIRGYDSSLRYVPMLTTLDLSHNSIQAIEEIVGLPNLKHLNLGFNQLEKTPIFSKEISDRLQVLVLRNNFIQDIESISKLSNLTQLDLRENCLIEHETLTPLRFLAALQFLNLTGNPLSFHPSHRISTVQYLHRNTSSVKFILDENLLSLNEQQNIGCTKSLFNLNEPSEGPSEPSENLERSIRIRPAIINEPKLDEEIVPIIRKEVTSKNNFPEIPNSIPKEYIKALYGKSGVTPLDLTLEGTSVPSSSTPLQDYISDEISKVTMEVPISEPISSEETGIYDESEDQEELSDDDFDSGDSNIFLVNIRDAHKDVFAILGKNHLVERNAITSKVLAKFSLDSISVCIKTIEDNVEYVYVEFETLRNTNHRYYCIESPEEKERFYGRVRSLVEARPAKNVLKVFTCLKCSMEFAVEEQNTVHKDKIHCPSCDSNLVFEGDNN